jgi:hypothetical protein
VAEICPYFEINPVFRGLFRENSEKENQKNTGIRVFLAARAGRPGISENSGPKIGGRSPIFDDFRAETGGARQFTTTFPPSTVANRPDPGRGGGVAEISPDFEIKRVSGVFFATKHKKDKKLESGFVFFWRPGPAAPDFLRKSDRKSGGVAPFLTIFGQKPGVHASLPPLSPLVL